MRHDRPVSASGIIRRAAAAALAAAMLCGAAAAGADCPGDCDGSGIVQVNELVRGVAVALGSGELSGCPAFDRNGDGRVAVNELLIAVNALLTGCPPVTPMPTSSSTELPTATPTLNAPPVLPTPLVYRAYPGFAVALPLGVTDPEGGPLQCSVEMLPAGAAFDAEQGRLDWTPATDQLGPFYVPFTCRDDATPPASVAGQLTFAVAPLDACTTPSCEPAAGCTSVLAPITQPCCAAGPAARVIEPVAGCPEGRVLYVGGNDSGFGRLQNCDHLRLRVFNQAGAEVRFHIETRCLNVNNRVRLRARLETDSPMSGHKVLFDSELPPFFLDPNGDNGFAVRRNVRFGVTAQGPFFDLENAEGNLTLSLTDADDVSVSQVVRVILNSLTPVPDLPDVDPPAPTPTATPG